MPCTPGKRQAPPSANCATPLLPPLPPLLGYSLERYHPAVLVLCGSFNPPTFMHLRMLELAQQALAKVGLGLACLCLRSSLRVQLATSQPCAVRCQQ